jgi:16S rRNA G527 N7-methylase RsmG
MSDRLQRIEFDPEEILRQFDLSSLRHKYFDLLLRENKRINLVSRETSQDDLERLSAESLLPLTRLSRPIGNYLDIGSGGGFPAVPLLLSGVITGKAILIERTQKKAGALRRMLLALNLSAEILPIDFSKADLLPVCNLITVRLVKMTPKLLERGCSLLATGGVLICFSRVEFDFAPADLTSSAFVYSSDEVEKYMTFYHRR